MKRWLIIRHIRAMKLIWQLAWRYKMVWGGERTEEAVMDALQHNPLFRKDWEHLRQVVRGKA